jgi:AcrR family transcriptional regulator
MAQVLKPAVRARIEQAALALFAERGYPGTTMAAVASASGTAPANLYRYFGDKARLFDAVVPPDLVARHDELLDSRVGALAAHRYHRHDGEVAADGEATRDDQAARDDEATRDDGADRDEVSHAAAELLDFWIGHRLAVVVLLDRATGTPYAGYPERFVERLTAHVEHEVPALTSDQRFLLRLVFDNTRRAIAGILHATADRMRIEALVAGFWSYQLPGLDGLLGTLRRPTGCAG